MKTFLDIRDKTINKGDSDKSSLGGELRLILKNFLQSDRFSKALLTFLLWEISFYSAHMLDVDLRIEDFKGLTLAMILGYLIGVGCLWKIPNKTDAEMIKIGYQISIFSFIPIFILYLFVSNIKWIIICCYFFYSLGAAFLAPSLFSTLSKEKHVNEQGKIYGLLDSTDTIAFLLATIITVMYHWIEFSKIVLISISFLTFLISLWPYARFRRTNPVSR